MSERHMLRGRCHCGNLEVLLETAIHPAEFQTRACQCGFCRRHNALNISDPDGLTRIVLHDPTKVLRYQFALRTADFLICGVCGVYAAAVMEEGGRHYSTLNINIFEERDAFPPPEPMVYDAEDTGGRRARRAARWTPTEILAG